MSPRRQQPKPSRFMLFMGLGIVSVLAIFLTMVAMFNRLAPGQGVGDKVAGPILFVAVVIVLCAIKGR
jgi:hypothetical protein